LNSINLETETIYVNTPSIPHNQAQVKKSWFISKIHDYGNCSIRGSDQPGPDRI